MNSNDVKLSPERIETDSSLQKERAKADQELTKRQSVAEKDAEQVVELARERADRLLEAERQKADATLEQADDPAEAADGLSVARESEDDRVTEERDAADDRIEAESAANKEAHTLLLEVEREETDERLLSERAHSDRAVASRDEFLGVVSHEMRGILAGMALSADMMMARPQEGAAGKQAHQEAQRLRRYTERMNRLIGDMLDVVSMELGKLNVVFTQEDPRRLLTETMQSFRLMAAARGTRMTSEVSQNLVLVSFDHDRILQVLTNLVGNAMKFTNAGGSIELRLAAVHGGVEFTVRDNGSGIAPDQLDAIFERYSQEASAAGRGLGLGLYISRGIIDAHGGKIWAESELGNGSTFHFTLPLARPT